MKKIVLALLVLLLLVGSVTADDFNPGEHFGSIAREMLALRNHGVTKYQMELMLIGQLSPNVYKLEIPETDSDRAQQMVQFSIITEFVWEKNISKK